MSRSIFKLTHLQIFKLFVISILISSCNIINPAEPIPSYIRVEKFTLTTDPGTQGAATNDIRDVWVYVDGQIVGVFEMPVSVPVLYSGTHTINLSPGVIVNGISSTRINYPFYATHSQSLDLQSGAIDTINPTVTYTSITFSQLEDFDQSGVTFMPTGQSADTTIHIINDPGIILDGNCGAALLDANHSTFEFISIDSFPMPSGSIKYMEIDYKTDNEFSIGLQSFSTFAAYKDDILILKPTDTWQKIYVNLNTMAEQHPSATHFKVFMRGALSNGKSTAKIYFDNIKVVRNG